ncbi:Uncharacterised protein [Chryseobacterium gleum]|uniref:Uncharacterized protein n=2 Tax=Chryseobacterium gleum TaxID=250 RepID=A0A3S4R582_CHRGE|nr:hypothetical protein [Chryseobacterium gleum]EFK36865.1 hypothetical protein HMPREF0204_11422 [Chryseobacterium gleum ATCC 35910]QQY32113.1 hypothetical protein I6I60_25330 [Chryseobacterium gleum]VEE10662.1 Uncharacterised protein [Chryseobacterium gleum]
MKKIFFIAALGVAGFMSAKGSADNKVIRKAKTTDNKSVNSNTSNKAKAAFYNWIGVSTWCGKVFYLDASDYSSFEELDAAATQFTNQQCAGASTFTGQYT